MTLSGAEILLRCLLAEGTKKIFGYPGGAIMDVFNAMYDHRQDFDNILVRHEQGAIHAAQGYARVSGEPGVVVVTSGPGATNVITGIADANIDSTPLVVVTGQVGAPALGTDAFQETDFIGMTLPISKWSYQIRRAEDVRWAVARAFYLARTGRPGPVVLDFAKNAQIATAEWDDAYEPCTFIRSYVPVPTPDTDSLWQAVQLINAARRPFAILGQGVVLSGAEPEFLATVRKTGIPFGATLLGLSAAPSDMPGYLGMIGMHGSVAANKMQQQADLIVVVGCRFADRITGPVSGYAPHAKIVHIDIDPSELGKNVRADVPICGDAREVLARLLPHLEERDHSAWLAEFDFYRETERRKVIDPEVHPAGGPLHMGEVIDKVAEVGREEAIVVTDVGQNQMFSARYSRFRRSRSFLSSGGMGTMGFGLPAAIGAKMAAPDREVVVFVGDGGIQMTLQELGTVMQERTAVKVVIFDNTWLGNVRQWQELFFAKRYSQTRLLSPDYLKIAEAYGIRARRLTDRAELDDAVREMMAADEPYILHVCTEEENMVYPMVPPGQPIDHVLLSRTEKI